MFLKIFFEKYFEKYFETYCIREGYGIEWAFYMVRLLVCNLASI